MILFEIETGECGFAYVRCYVWATNEENAREHFQAKYGDKHKINLITALMASTDGPFITELSDEGWEAPE